MAAPNNGFLAFDRYIHRRDFCSLNVDASVYALDSARWDGDSLEFPMSSKVVKNSIQGPPRSARSDRRSGELNAHFIQASSFSYVLPTFPYFS